MIKAPDMEQIRCVEEFLLTSGRANKLDAGIQLNLSHFCNYIREARERDEQMKSLAKMFVSLASDDDE